MRVLMLPSWYPHAGDSLAGIFVRRQIEAVARTCAVAVLCVVPDPGIEDGGFQVVGTDEGGLHVVRVRLGSNLPDFSPAGPTSPGYAAAAAAGLAHLMARWGFPDLCHVHVLPHPGRIALELAARFGIPYVISEHWSGYMAADGRYQRAGNGSLTRAVVAGASAVAPVSAALCDAMRAQGLAAEYTVVPNVVPRRARVSGPPALTDGLRLLCVARLDDGEKNLSGLLRALARVPARQKARLALDIVGGGPDRGPLEALCRDLALDGRVRFHGERPNAEIGDWLARCHMLVCNSWFETFSISTAEALVHGRPVIATDCGGPADYLDSACSLVVPTGDTAALAEALGRAEGSYPDLARSTTEAFDPQRFRAEAVGDTVLGLYRAALSVSRPAWQIGRAEPVSGCRQA